MRIILRKPPDTAQSTKRTTRFVAMNDSKLCHPDWKLPIAPISRIEYQSMARAVHRLEPELLLVDRKREHVVFVVLPMTRCHPEFGAEHVGRDDW